MDNIAGLRVLASGLILLLTIITRSSARARDDNEYCIREAFNASCGHDEVIMMTSARYGRMREGRCVGGEYGIVGCSVDVLKHIDQKCSGRRKCGFTVRSLIEVAQPCPRDLSNYLEATYSCVKVAKSNKMGCLKDGHIKIGEENGYIASASVTSNGPGTRKCPWKITLDPKQRIQMTLFDFDKPMELFNKETHCSLYAVIEEETHTRELSLCQQGVRNQNLYTSTTNVAAVYFINNQQERHFMIKYKAIGCPTLKPPGTAWATQDALTATVRCNETEETWYLTCKGNTWIGEVGNCSKGAVPWGSQHIYGGKTGFPYGILVAVIIGVILGAIIGSILLGFVYMCFRKQADPSSARSRYPNDPPEMTLALRVGDDGKSVYPSLVKPVQSPRPPHPGDYQYGYGRPSPPGVRALESAKIGRTVSPDKPIQPPFLSQSTSDESDHIYESANFERGRPYLGDKLPAVYYELESEGFVFLEDGEQRK